MDCAIWCHHCLCGVEEIRAKVSSLAREEKGKRGILEYWYCVCACVRVYARTSMCV